MVTAVVDIYPVRDTSDNFVGNYGSLLACISSGIPLSCPDDLNQFAISFSERLFNACMVLGDNAGMGNGLCFGNPKIRDTGAGG